MKRLAVTLMLCLALGAIINIAAGWSASVWAPFPKPQQRYGLLDVPEADLAVLSAAWRNPDPARQLDVRYEQRSARAFGKSISALFVNYRHKLDRTFGRNHARIVYRCGWPLRALEGYSLIDDAYYVTEGNFTEKTSWHGVIPLKTDPQSSAKDPLGLNIASQALPYVPIPVGFFVNTALFAGALLLITWTLAVARRALRLRAGLCPRCKYPIGPSPICTECGTPLPPRSNPAPPQAA